ncbi:MULTISPECIES: alpha/beta hydrolase [Tenacibaculum]|uniref:alpha/beta hydrolase n=1 Tax=Tenacibaculum TaxID=104267 RepID=UPI001F0AEF1B|nr:MULTISPECIES: alpha/beta hydrolase [Tenacibaculum]MCH3883068.1 lysophospholipase [Tenacibaculum aquimarinum]MDO6600563.1 alpha/beta hydrolase [Tenacibaculum sp. 1_MG-2023]
MIRLITYLIVILIGFTTSFAQVKSEEILIKNEGVELPGTLSFSEEKTPLLIWIHGSGGVDRNGNTPQYIKQFRDSINANKIAFFSYDKRTANKNNIVFLKQGVLFNDFVLDAKTVINHFKKDNRFSEIILVGHSQGSLIAMLASEKTDKYISLAGAGETIDKTLVRQLSAQNPVLGQSVKSHLKELMETGTIKEVNPMLAGMFSKQNLPFLRSWISINPTDEIKKITLPILILNGTKDLQVPVKDAENLHNANPSSKLVLIKNMNHVLKDIQKDQDNLKSYYSADFPLSTTLIKTVVTFVKK